MDCAEHKKLVSDLRAIAVRVDNASYLLDAITIRRLADEIEQVFCKPPEPPKLRVIRS